MPHSWHDEPHFTQRIGWLRASVLGANDGVNGQELWFSDGTEAGTVLIQDLNPLKTCSYGSSPGSGSDPCDSWPDWLTPLNGAVYFQADDGSLGTELWALPWVSLPHAVYLPLAQKK